MARTLLIALAAATMAMVASLVSCKSTQLAGEKFYIDSPGTGVAYLPRSMPAVHNAALAALRDDLGYTIDSDAPARITATTATARNVEIELSETGAGDTKMQINMSLDTPEMVVRDVMSKIEARLQ